jgi:hypothetical protein
MSKTSRLGALSLLATVFMLGAAGVARAQGCHVEPMPAATLLLPYFEEDLDNSTGLNTSFSVNNASSQPVVANVYVRSDLGVFIFGFPIYLKGYDVQTITLRDVLVNGALPQTNGTYPGCNTGALPPANPGPGTLWGYQQALIGQPVNLFGYLCAGRNLGDRIARGYITIDAMNNCTTLTQPNSGYFTGGGTGNASNRNVLWGDYFYQNPALNQAEGHPLVHILADVTNLATSTAGRYTFYGKDVSWSAIDNRVPLATNFQVRYFNQYPFSSSLVVWRDSKVVQGPFTCGALPPWYPLGQATIIAFDEDSHSVALTASAFPAVAQRVSVGGSPLATPYSFGWFFLDLNVAAGTNPSFDPRSDQAWVTTSLTNGVTVGIDGIRLDNACNARHSGPL